MTTDRELLQRALIELTEAGGYTYGLIKDIQERLEQPEQTPVAWLYLDDLERFKTNETYANAYSIKVSNPDKGETVPLYIAPQPAQKPLTENQIDDLWVEHITPIHRADYRDMVRAIEAAHNIKETK